MPGFAPAPTLPAGPRVRTGKRDTSQAQLCLGVPALHRDHPDSWTLAVLNAVLGDGMSSRLFLSVREELGLAYDVSSGIVDYADAGALEVSAGVDPASLPEALEAILVELARLRDEPVPAAELDKAKRYLSGGLELRMDDTRHVASWIGGQEALHDRVLTLDEALAAVAAVDAASIQALAGTTLPRRRAAARGGRAGTLPARPRGPPPAAGMTAPAMTKPDEAQPARSRRIELVLAHMHLRLGALELSRVELETLAGLGGLDPQGLVDLAEVRWRTGDLLGAGEAAAAALRTDGSDPTALIVAAEAASAIGRPSEARRLATRAIAASHRQHRPDLRRDATLGCLADRRQRTRPDGADIVRSGARSGRAGCAARRSSPGAERGPGCRHDRSRSDDAEPVGRRHDRGRRGDRPARPRPGVRGGARGARRRPIRRGGPAVRSRPAARAGSGTGRPGGDRGCAGILAVGRPR